MDYEKGSPRNLVQFSEYNDLAFTDTGVQINDNAKPSKNVVWSSDKIERRLAELRGGMPPPQSQMLGFDTPMGGANVRVPYLYDTSGEKYPNGYRRYWKSGSRDPDHHSWRFPRIFHPSWYLSFIIPSRKHYCDKCCNYLQHTWSTVWNDDPTLANNKCGGMNKCSCSACKNQLLKK